VSGCGNAVQPDSRAITRGVDQFLSSRNLPEVLDHEEIFSRPDTRVQHDLAVRRRSRPEDAHVAAANKGSDPDDLSARVDGVDNQFVSRVDGDNRFPRGSGPSPISTAFTLPPSSTILKAIWGWFRRARSRSSSGTSSRDHRSCRSVRTSSRPRGGLLKLPRVPERA
jgi:hypothetical protein